MNNKKVSLYNTSQEHEFGYYKPPNIINYLRKKSSEVSHGLGRYNLYSNLVSRYSKIFKRPFDIDWEGIKIRLYPRSNASDKHIFKYGIHSEQEDLEFLKQKYKGKNLCVFDIGANIGVFTLFLSKILGPESNIVCFEPHPKTFERLLANLSFNFNENISPMNFGIGNKKEKKWLYSINPNNIGQNTLLSEFFTHDRLEINIDTLENVVIEKKITNIDFLKIDIEGFEDRALLPFMENFKNKFLPKHILIEDNRAQWKTDCLQYLSSNGYEVIAVNKAGKNFHFYKT